MADTYVIKNRKKAVSKNVTINIISKVVTLLIGFFTRKLLLTFIAVEYLGLSSLFVNVLDLLNLAELGIGVALQVRLFKPLVDDDRDKIGNILSVARKVYLAIAIIVMVAGSLTCIFLPYIIRDNPFDDWYVRIAFMIAVGGIALSYLCADKRLFYESNESLYIATLTDIISKVVLTALGLLLLGIFREYLLFLALSSSATFLSNFFLFLLYKSKHKGSYVVDKAYQKQEFTKVRSNLKDVIPNKISVFIFSSTDSIVITIFIGLTLVAIYSNYMTIFMAFLSMSAIASNGLVSTFGKMIKEKKDQKDIYDKFLKYEILQFMFSSFSAICLYCLVDKFIIAWVGEEYLLGFWPVLLLVADYLIHSLFQPMSTLFTSTEKFKEDKLCSFISAGINIGCSILLVYFIGIEGVIIGTLVSNIFTYIFRVRLIYRSYFKKSMIKRLLVGLVQIVLTAGLGYLTLLVVREITFDNKWLTFIVSGVVAFVLSNTINIALIIFYIFKFRRAKMKEFLKKHFPRAIKLYKSMKMKHFHKKVISLNKKRKPYHHDKLKVVFISQCEHIFDKTKPVVDECIRRGFDVVIYVVKDEVSTYEDKTIFEKEFPELCVKNEDVPLKDLEPDYVFYPRPYVTVIPKDVQPLNVLKYSKICFIPYGYSLMKLGYVNLNDDFISCANFMFLDNKYSKDYADEHIDPKLTEYNKILDIGYAYFDLLLKDFDSFVVKEHDCFKDFDKKNKYNVIWAPRWINDDKLGGSNMIRYWKQVAELLVNNPNYNFCFRPHPYAFDFYVKSGQISVEERDDYLNNIKNSSNSIHDTHSDYIATFKSSDALICDVSSIIAEYLFLGKPVIFCHNEKEEILNDITNEMLKVFYNAYSFEDVERYITDLSKGIDPLKVEREAYVKKYKEQFYDSSKRIVDVIEKDYKGENNG